MMDNSIMHSKVDDSIDGEDLSKSAIQSPPIEKKIESQMKDPLTSLLEEVDLHPDSEHFKVPAPTNKPTTAVANKPDVSSLNVSSVPPMVENSTQQIPDLFESCNQFFDTENSTLENVPLNQDSDTAKLYDDGIVPNKPFFINECETTEISLSDNDENSFSKPELMTSPTAKHAEAASPYFQSTAKHVETASPYFQSTAKHVETASPYFQSTAKHVETASPYFQSTAKHVETASPYFQSPKLSDGQKADQFNKEVLPEQNISFSETRDLQVQPTTSNKKEKSDFIEITISDPQKIGEGMGSYMAYAIHIKTDIPYFKKKVWSVSRRFSDFLGLHSKLVEKYLHLGVIIPPAPEKDAFATTKIKLSQEKGADSGSAEFIERRRAALERFLNRTAGHSRLRTDPDFREFLELDAELPRSTSTSTLSGAGVLRLFNKVGETVNKITFKMEESDQWFEEKIQHIENLDGQLRKLHSSMEGLVSYRRELANCTSSFSKSTAVLSSVEEHSALSRALHQLSEATDRIHTIHHAQADADFFHLSEVTKDYINLIGAVKEVFHERVKLFQTWQHAQSTLGRKRENKAKMELTGRIERVEGANEEVKEWEGKVDRSEEEFTKISKSIKAEMENFDASRIDDFKDMFIKYLEAILSSQYQVVKVWEQFLPEAKAIS